MKFVTRGHGAPLLLVPGIQGRWEYMRPAIDVLAQSFQVITFALCGERASGLRFDPANRLDNFVDQIDRVLDACGRPEAAICGVSFGGLIALRYAARRPARATALILASTPGPSFTLRPRHRLYLKAPRLFGPVFLAEIPRRVREEIAVALPAAPARRRFALRQLRTFFDAPLSMTQMAARARLLGAPELVDDCAAIVKPTLVVTGEPALDHVVPVGGTSDYVRLIANARAERVERTGHLGYITRPEAFAEIVRAFLNRRADAAA